MRVGPREAATCSTPISRRTRRGTASCPPVSTAAIAKRASSRRSSSASAAFARSSALGIEPAVFHLNEGHAGFVVLQRIRDLIEQGSNFDDALEAGPADDRLHDPHAGAGRPRRVPLSSWSRSISPAAWGTLGTNRARSSRSATRQRRRSAVQHDGARAARSAGVTNARQRSCTAKSPATMWARHVAGASRRRWPIKSITNGVHVPTWMASRHAAICSTRHLGAELDQSPGRPGSLGALSLAIPDEELWASGSRRRR
ncbi:MAG: hypothetical protein QM736_28185 [Vicinamibacterales bacterium]